METTFGNSETVGLFSVQRKLRITHAILNHLYKKAISGHYLPGPTFCLFASMTVLTILFIEIGLKFIAKITISLQ